MQNSQLEEALKFKGILFKKGEKGLIKLWQERFFQIEEGSRLAYYDQESDAKKGKEAKGSVPLLELINVTSQDKYEFAVEVPGRTFLLKANTTEEKAKWMEYLMLIHKHLKAPEKKVVRAFTERLGSNILEKVQKELRSKAAMDTSNQSTSTKEANIITSMAKSDISTKQESKLDTVPQQSQKTDQNLPVNSEAPTQNKNDQQTNDSNILQPVIDQTDATRTKNGVLNDSPVDQIKNDQTKSSNITVATNKFTEVKQSNKIDNKAEAPVEKKKEETISQQKGVSEGGSSKAIILEKNDNSNSTEESVVASFNPGSQKTEKQGSQNPNEFKGKNLPQSESAEKKQEKEASEDWTNSGETADTLNPAASEKTSLLSSLFNKIKGIFCCMDGRKQEEDVTQAVAPTNCGKCQKSVQQIRVFLNETCNHAVCADCVTKILTSDVRGMCPVPECRAEIVIQELDEF